MRAIDGRLTLADGRTLAWCEYGPEDGRPILQFQGTPGSRFSRHAHEEAYDRLGVRVIVFDRPGYGAATRLPGRGISVVADDAAALLDHLGHDVVRVSGGSGGGPHVLAFATQHPERVQAATVVVGGAPLLEEDMRPESEPAHEKGRRRPPPLSPIAPGLADCRQSQPWSRPRYRQARVRA